MSFGLKMNGGDEIKSVNMNKRIYYSIQMFQKIKYKKGENMARVMYNTIKRETRGERMNLYKHKIFLNDETISNYDFEAQLNNGKTRYGNEDPTANGRVYLKNKIEKISDNLYLLWFVRDTPVVDEEDELIQNRIDENGERLERVQYDVEELIQEDINKVYNYFVVFDVDTSHIFTTNSTANPSSPNKNLIKYFIDADKISIDSEVDYAETLAQARTNKVKIKFHKGNADENYGSTEIEERLISTAKEWFGAEYIVSQEFRINDNWFKSKNGAAKLDAISTEDNCAIYVEAVDNEGNEFSIDNRVIKKPTEICEDTIKVGNDMYNEIIKYFSQN